MKGIYTTIVISSDNGETWSDPQIPVVMEDSENKSHARITVTNTAVHAFWVEGYVTINNRYGYDRIVHAMSYLARSIMDH